MGQNPYSPYNEDDDPYRLAAAAMAAAKQTPPRPQISLEQHRESLRPATNDSEPTTVSRVAPGELYTTDYWDVPDPGGPLTGNLGPLLHGRSRARYEQVLRHNELERQKYLDSVERAKLFYSMKRAGEDSGADYATVDEYDPESKQTYTRIVPKRAGGKFLKPPPTEKKDQSMSELEFWIGQNPNGTAKDYATWKSGMQKEAKFPPQPPTSRFQFLGDPNTGGVMRGNSLTGELTPAPGGEGGASRLSGPPREEKEDPLKTEMRKRLMESATSPESFGGEEIVGVELSDINKGLEKSFPSKKPARGQTTQSRGNTKQPAPKTLKMKDGTTWTKKDGKWVRLK